MKNILYKDKRGSTIFVRLMLSMVCFIFGLAIASSLQKVTADSQTQMNCSTATNSDYATKANCTTTDWFLPFGVGIALAIAGFLLSGRI